MQQADTKEEMLWSYKLQIIKSPYPDIFRDRQISGAISLTLIPRGLCRGQLLAPSAGTAAPGVRAQPPPATGASGCAGRAAQKLSHLRFRHGLIRIFIVMPWWFWLLLGKYLGILYSAFLAIWETKTKLEKQFHLLCPTIFKIMLMLNLMIPQKFHDTASFWDIFIGELLSGIYRWVLHLELLRVGGPDSWHFSDTRNKRRDIPSACIHPLVFHSVIHSFILRRNERPLKDQWEALCARSCELTAQDVLFFNRSVSVIISYVKQLLTSAVTGLILSALISPVMRCGVAVEQFLSQREFYLNKICLRTFRNSAESCCSGSGRYLLLAVIHKSRNKGGYACELARATDGVSSSLAAVARSVSVQMTWPERGPRYVWC